MNKYKVYIPVMLIILMFFALVYFRNDMIRYISKNKTEQLPTTAKDTIVEYITKNYNYSQNGESYKYTFLEFGSTGCYACRQMEDVMAEIKSKYEGKVKVVFVNLTKKENRTLSDFFGIVSIPTQVLLDKNGNEFFRHNGFYSSEQLSRHFINIEEVMINGTRRR